MLGDFLRARAVFVADGYVAHTTIHFRHLYLSAGIVSKVATRAALPWSGHHRLARAVFLRESTAGYTSTDGFVINTLALKTGSWGPHYATVALKVDAALELAAAVLARGAALARWSDRVGAEGLFAANRPAIPRPRTLGAAPARWGNWVRAVRPQAGHSTAVDFWPSSSCCGCSSQSQHGG